MPLLDDPAELAARRAQLSGPHMAPLCHLARTIRLKYGAAPDADPADGGDAARLLLLLETPGPTIGHSGFVSADNRTGTAANLRRLWSATGLARQDRLIWNAVPWVIHTGGPNRAPRAGEIREGLALLPALLQRVPRLCVGVLAGRIAGMAAPVVALSRPEVLVMTMPHPSPTYVCTSPDVSRRIVATLTHAAAHL